MEKAPASAKELDECGLIPPRVPDHALLKRIGRGSYGEVWLGRNMLGVFRAIKVVYRHKFDSPRPYERELQGIRKFEPVSRMHEGLIDILHVGQNDADGYFYYVMEIADDVAAGDAITPDAYVPRSLAREVKRRGRLPAEGCIAIGAALANALDFLHRHSLIHRDVKPSNILFVNNVPKLADIGLVTDIGEAQSLVGTDGYIPPEGPGTARADIYSLGKLLYEIGTGNDRRDFPDLPESIAGSAHENLFLELNQVILKACQLDARRRYPSAKAVAEELVLIGSGKSVRRLRHLERAMKKIKVGAAVSALAALVIGPVLYSLNTRREELEQDRQRRLGMTLAEGAQTLQRGELLGALPHYVDALSIDGNNEDHADNYRLSLAAVLSRSPALEQFYAFPNRVNGACFSPDGQSILIALYFDKARVFESNTGWPRSRFFGPDTGLTEAVFSPEGGRVLTSSENGLVQIWNSVTGKLIHSFRIPSRIYGAAFSPNGRRIVAACMDGVARIWDVASGRMILQLPKQSGPLNSAQYSGDSLRIVTASRNNSARIWNAETGAPIGPPLMHGSWVYQASFSPDGKQVVTASYDRTARVWDTQTFQEVLPSMVHGDGVRSAEFSPDGRYILTASFDSTARLWDARTHEPVPLNALLRHSDRVVGASFSPAQDKIITACVDGTVRIWNFATDVPSFQATYISENSKGVQFLSSGANSTSAGLQHPPTTGRFFGKGSFLGLSRTTPGGRILEVFAVSNRRRLYTVPFAGSLESASFSPEGKLLSCADGNTTRVYNLSRDKELYAFKTRTAASRTVLSDDGRRIVILAGNYGVLADPIARRFVCRPIDLGRNACDAAFSPNGRLFATCTRDDGFNACSARVWSAENGEPVSPPLAHKDGITAVAFSPDSTKIVTASEDFTAAVWDVKTGRRLLPTLRHSSQVSDVCFSPDGRWIVTLDTQIHIWDARNGLPIVAPIPCPFSLGRIEEVNNYEVIVSSKSTVFWRIPLVRDRHSLAQLKLFSWFLNGFETGSSGEETVPHNPEVLQARWDALRKSWPTEDSKTNLVEWHEFSARDCEHSGNWAGAVFHWKKALEIDPNGSFIRERLRLDANRLLTSPKSAPRQLPTGG